MDRMRLPIVVGFCLLLGGCGRDIRPTDADATYPVTGEVTVDGSPVNGVRVICHRDAPEQQYPGVSVAVTGADGRFAFATYVEGDGLREGQYVLTFDWREGYAAVSGLPIGPDKLGDRYQDPGKSSTRFTVSAGAPVDLGRIELTTK